MYRISLLNGLPWQVVSAWNRRATHWKVDQARSLWYRCRRAVEQLKFASLCNVHISVVAYKVTSIRLPLLSYLTFVDRFNNTSSKMAAVLAWAATRFVLHLLLFILSLIGVLSLYSGLQRGAILSQKTTYVASISLQAGLQAFSVVS